MKDKLKIPKRFDDYAKIANINSPDITQCPKCLSLSHISDSHKCDTSWKACSICGLDLNKKGKTRLINGTKYVSISFKKYYTVWNKVMCWNCAFMIHKKFSKDVS